ncbi:MAG: VCBS repeat-containing protein [Cyclobacteriaceae bacterium]
MKKLDLMDCRLIRTFGGISICMTLLIGLLLGLTSCSHSVKRFEKIESASSHISFSNDLIETDTLNYFTYPYLYMGGGVAVGDINNDGLADIFFTGNMVKNSLYLNQGAFQFKDITEDAHIGGTNKWYSGVTMVDANADGLLDIYLSVSGKYQSTRNELYINNGDLTFSEKASEYGIDDIGKSVQSTFFDYDHDGDLDLYVANYPITRFSTPNSEYRKLMDEVTLENSDHLYQNDGEGHFQDVTEQAGLLSFGLSLSATIGDLNNDGWDDIYVSNDFSTPDYLFINNADGTFSEKVKKATKQFSFYGMGVDIADFNNDGLMDIIQVDMAAEDNRRAKANMASMNPGLFWGTVEYGMHYQYMYNSLQLNRGQKDGVPVLSNIAWMGNVATTDWSWGPLLADFDNDGWKDLFITNGTRRDINNKDFFNGLKKNLNKASEEELKLEVENIPSEPIGNYIFRNKGDLTFQKSNEEWGVDMVGFSNGGAYADLDNDGDLDLIVNNIDEPASIFKNNSNEIGSSNYLKLKLHESESNPFGIGAKVEVTTGQLSQFSHLTLSRGFQSSVEPVVYFGLSNIQKIDSIVVTWNDGSVSIKTDVEANQTLSIKKSDDAFDLRKEEGSQQQIFTDLSDSLDLPSHEENYFDDYRFQVLLPHKMSNWGPALAVADVNGDGLEDFYFGAASRSSGRLYTQTKEGAFQLMQTFSEDEMLEDLDAVFVDIDNDGDQDLFVVSGGNEFPSQVKFYADRLYINEDGIFSKSDILPQIISSGSCVRPFDYDQDGDLDLFVGGRLSPLNYPQPGTSYLLTNQLEKGSLSFIENTEAIAPGLKSAGMITDAIWTDFNDDELVDLLVVGEWMPISIYINDGNKLINQTEGLGYSHTAGWWFSIEKGDFNQDGLQDFIVGNLGLNYKYKATTDETFDLYVSDFDQNNKADLVLGYFNNGEQFPVRGRQCSSEQIPAIEQKFKNYESFAAANLIEIYGEENLKKSAHYQIESFASIIMINRGGGDFETSSLPKELQLSAVNDLQIRDFNQDGYLDVIAAGNLYASEVETPRNDAGIGSLLIGDGKGGFDYQTYSESGLLLDRDVKKLAVARGAANNYLLAASNNGPLSLFKFEK